MIWEVAALPFFAIWGVMWFVLPWIPTDNRLVRTACFYLITALQLRYLWWRLVDTLPAAVPRGPFVYAVTILLLEMALVYPSYDFLGKLLRSHERSSEADAHEGWFSSLSTPVPFVDILVPTYNEAWPVLERTIVGATSQDYPRVRVWVCDDGRRAWLRERAEALGARYLSRADNRHAKAGNLNSALAQIEALVGPPEFVAVLDADFVPRRRFVSRTMALMYEPRIGIVQTPQHHMNPDPFQAAFRSWDGWPDTQRLMFNVVLPARDAEGIAFCCGTSFLSRGAALRAIGGFPTESITEDVLTSMKMRHAGYRTVYLRELLTTGLAAEGLHEYLTQRGRWSLGGVQIAWWVSGLSNRVRTRWQRFLGIEPFLRWGYVSLIRVIFLMVPLVYWLFGISPAYLNLAGLLWYSLPLIALQRCYMSWLSGGAHLPILAQAETLIASFAVVPGMLRGLFDRSQHRFIVTDKGVNRGGKVIHWRILRWLAGYGLLTVAGIVYRFFVAERGAGDTAFSLVILMWSATTLATVLVAASLCIEAPQRRRDLRYATADPVSLATAAGPISAELADLSLSGAQLTTSEPLRIGDEVTLHLAGVSTPLPATVVRLAGHRRHGVVFRSTDHQRHELIRKIFCSDRYVHPPQRGSGIVVARAILRRIAA